MGAVVDVFCLCILVAAVIFGRATSSTTSIVGLHVVEVLYRAHCA